MVERLGRVALLCAAVGLLSAPGGHAQDKKETATAEIKNAKGDSLGSLKLTDTGSGLQITGNLKNLPPGKHGFHIHEVGKCDPPDFKTAGSHLNPDHKQHGKLNPSGYHAGDLGNVTVGLKGDVSLNVTAKNTTLGSVLKSGSASLVIHAQEDDLKTDPSGNSGDRIACGVIAK